MLNSIFKRKTLFVHQHDTLIIGLGKVAQPERYICLRQRHIQNVVLFQTPSLFTSDNSLLIHNYFPCCGQSARFVHKDNADTKGFSFTLAVPMSRYMTCKSRVYIRRFHTAPICKIPVIYEH